MSVHNDEQHLAAAMESVLRQTWPDFELLVIDDASNDRSREIARSFRDPRVRVISNDANLGLTRSLNRGLSLIRSEYVARLDGNDVSLPERLARQIAFLDTHPEVAVLGVQAMPIDVHGRRIRRVGWFHPQWYRPTGGFALEWYRMFDTPFVHSGVMFRREVVASLGGYDENHPLEQDAELWMRVGRRWKLANLDEELIAFRADPTSMTADPDRPERRGYAERKTRIIDSLLAELLQSDSIPRRVAELWVTANDPIAKMSRDEITAVVTALDDCADRFFELHPEARHDRLIARHRASMVARLIDKADRTTIGVLWNRARRLDARSSFALVPRTAAFLLFGNSTFRLWRHAVS